MAKKLMLYPKKGGWNHGNMLPGEQKAGAPDPGGEGTVLGGLVSNKRCSHRSGLQVENRHKG